MLLKKNKVQIILIPILVVGVAAIFISVPKEGYTDFTNQNLSGDEIVIDNRTGLMWENGPLAPNGDYESALTYCNGLDYAGYTDWRLPTVKEFISIIDFTRESAPFIDTIVFDTWESNIYWTSTYDNNAGAIMIVQLNNGTNFAFGTTNTVATIRMRCVRNAD